MTKPLPTQKELHTLFEYSPTTGLFTYKIKPNQRIRIGSVAGTIHKVTGYRLIQVNKKSYKASRLAWMYVYGEDPGDLTVDHIDRDKANDAIDNLRLATQSQQLFNRSGWNKSTGIRGVRYNQKTETYSAVICFGGLNTTKQFNTAEEAQTYYNKLRAEHGGKFAV
jgi:hypothetical protein